MNSPQNESNATLNVEAAVRDRYSGAAQEREAALCCPVDYDARYLKIIPNEIIERDYGCGDPSRHVREGETVLDLGSGGGKICYIAAQIVGAAGQVIGVDCNVEMLGLARQYQPEMAKRLGYDVVSFRKGRIEDLQLDLDLFEKYLQENPVHSSADWLRAQGAADELRRTEPLIPDNTVDVVVSNCVLNLVSYEHRRQLFAEIFRVLKPGGRAVISDITCDREVPLELQNDPTLWSGCISGAFRDDQFMAAFEQAGFQACVILERQAQPWTTVKDIEFRSMTIQASKPLPGNAGDRSEEVFYNGPWLEVVDDQGNRLRRGERSRVSSSTLRQYGQTPCGQQITPVSSETAASTELQTFPLQTTDCCSPGGSCC
ncbi:methyltransferase domain-containing protein [Rubinisphaera margarita]|uniref:methyltransferase domain-containing protein n=1 Tax=Rubinisphaera margarita TaxID=2909586 RepID=UPI001EE93301|nr:methyltransferase domain-containing protein [Rubinisphaera margarita]MCG6154325.1 methyltransferase domain-containing protein [Rubinisphaera margarita]